MAATVTMKAPYPSGTVQSSYGNYPIVAGEVNVDARLVTPLIDAGFTVANVGYATVEQIAIMLSGKADVAALASKADAALVANALNTKANVSSVPIVAEVMVPLPETNAGTPGPEGLMVSGAKHTHPRLTSAQYGTTNASGVIGPFTFAGGKVFDKMPCPILSAVGAPGIICNVSSWIQDAQGNYTGATILATRRTATTAPTTTLVLTVNVLTAANTSNTDVPVAGQLVSIVMLAQT